jgi:hypothetical protein
MRVLKNQYLKKKNKTNMNLQPDETGHKKTYKHINPTNLVVINPTPKNLNPRYDPTSTHIYMGDILYTMERTIGLRTIGLLNFRKKIHPQPQ